MRLGWSRCRRWTQLLALLLLWMVIGCGSTFRVSGALNVSNPSTAAGAVSFVQFTAIFDSAGTLVNVTIVTLANPAAANTFTFCGNQTSQFKMNDNVQVNFNPGKTCSSLVSVAQH